MALHHTHGPDTMQRPLHSASDTKSILMDRKGHCEPTKVVSDKYGQLPVAEILDHSFC